jgi:hypothetical protein
MYDAIMITVQKQEVLTYRDVAEKLSVITRIPIEHLFFLPRIFPSREMNQRSEWSLEAITLPRVSFFSFDNTMDLQSSEDGSSLYYHLFYERLKEEKVKSMNKGGVIGSFFPWSDSTTYSFYVEIESQFPVFTSSTGSFPQGNYCMGGGPIYISPVISPVIHQTQTAPNPIQQSTSSNLKKVLYINMIEFG